GVLQGDNAWWLDVLEKGRASPYAKFFDIDWQPAKPELRGKVLLPVLGNHYGDVLEKKELELVKAGSEWSVAYFDHRFPLNKESLKGLNAKKLNQDPLALHR